MNASLALRTQLLQRIVEWSHACPEVQAVALVGSGARGDYPADEWSDIDLILVTSTPDCFLQSSGWLDAIDEPWISTVERDSAGKIVERRVLFRSGVDVDFIVLSVERVQALREEPLASIISRGMQVLLDKGDTFPLLHPTERAVQRACPPSLVEFSELVNDFWFHVVWTAKKIKRGELWTAKSCCDVYMKRLLLTMIEWHTHALDGWEIETWYNGRFIERWASASLLERLPAVFAHYEEADLWKALANTAMVFDTLARETAQQLHYPYPDSDAQSITNWLAALSPVTPG